MTEPNQPLEPDDFPLEAEKERICRQDGKPIARTDTEAMAHDIAERLNADEQRREEDKWSA
ncbi:hypothetical protein SSBR45G_02210 [Bradyrhizobium sp. SSBR45G]|uniref:hypothetical protein n=1 Tax=unclassified Bradyrhizobium TaxID=2631580 RepID=UPI002342A392|nr:MULTISPECIES: hypothetical protein [unclassified Bradyrhizobium]GLH75313.1 hypothetical protein SSBR45G_02210 [Bradyrhizobium sp. SSBR45G]GLH82900.1 hypothetical protein SSBR45R_03600 [Bradyrhizobium sp. SSBR45R]